MCRRGERGESGHTPFIAVYHRENANSARGDAPAILMHKLHLLRVRVLELNIEDAREVLAQVVTRRPLHTPPRCRHVRLHRGCHLGTGELLLLRLAATNHRNSEQILIYARVQIQDLVDLHSKRQELQA